LPLLGAATAAAIAFGKAQFREAVSEKAAEGSLFFHRIFTNRPKFALIQPKQIKAIALKNQPGIGLSTD
jgi:hypothetical protein